MALVQMLARRGLFSIHACAAVRNNGAVVAAAGPGSGKSTLALALAKAGASVLADDRVLVRAGGAGVQCLAWRGPVNVTPESMALFPELAGVPLPRGTFQGKLAVSPWQTYHTPLVESAQPRVLLFPHLTGQADSRLDPLPRGEALAELAPCSLFWVHRDVLAQHLAVLRDLVAGSACYRLGLGRDLAEVGRRVTDLLGG
jgi:hypothetical protein